MLFLLSYTRKERLLHTNDVLVKERLPCNLHLRGARPKYASPAMYLVTRLQQN